MSLQVTHQRFGRFERVNLHVVYAKGDTDDLWVEFFDTPDVDDKSGPALSAVGNINLTVNRQRIPPEQLSALATFLAGLARIGMKVEPQ